MNLKETIKRVLNEGLKERMIQFIDEYGIKSAVDFFGGWKVIEDTIDNERLTYKMKLDFIKYLVKEYQGISIVDLNEDPLFYDETDTSYHEIPYLALRGVTIQVWDKQNYDDLGEFFVQYERLDNEIIDNIFYLLMEHYRKGLQL